MGMNLEKSCLVASDQLVHNTTSQHHTLLKGHTQNLCNAKLLDINIL